MPKMTAPFKNILSDKYTAICELFTKELKNIHFECEHIRPELLECSVSL